MIEREEEVCGVNQASMAGFPLQHMAKAPRSTVPRYDVTVTTPGLVYEERFGKGGLGMRASKKKYLHNNILPKYLS
jgi:hypothetical protein